MDVSMDSTNKDYISSVLESLKANSLASKKSNIDGKILPRRYTTYHEPLKDAGSSKSNISNVKEKADTIRKPSSASVVHEKPQKTIIKIKEMRNEVSVNGAAVTIPIEAVESVNVCFVNTLYGYFIGDSVLENGQWLIRRVPFLLNEWTENTILKKDEIKRVPVWVKMHHVPIVAYSDVGLSLISTQIGKPLMLDSYTSNMCLNSWGRSAYDREGHTVATIDIEYEWTPPRCASCRIFDHETDTNLKDKECVNADGQTPVKSQFVNDSDEDVDEYTTMEEPSKADSNNQGASTLAEMFPHD
nr:hypothetical protein [Tanacetum cinerariifolium]